MKIGSVLKNVNEEQYNDVTNAKKIEWLSNLDGLIFKNLISKTEDNTIESFTPYTEDDTEVELLVPFPFDSMYAYFVKANVDFLNGEIDLYNANMTLYNAMYVEYVKDFWSNHVPITTAYIKGVTI